jgi:hypothetical protein
MYLLRQTHQFGWVPLSTVVEKIRVDVAFLQRLKAEERQAPLAEQRLMWNETMIRALTKQEREALKPLPSNEHVFTAEELDSLRTTGALPKSARADESSEVEIEVEKASGGGAEAMKADEAPGARAKARASGSGSTFSPATPYGLEVEVEVASDSDDCIVVAESLQMEALEPLKRRRRA